MLQPRFINTTFKQISVYVLVFVIAHIGTQISLLSKGDYSTSDFYLNSSFSLILIYWLGPRYVWPPFYLNAVVTSYLWGHSLDQWPLWFLYGLPETSFALLSWCLFRLLLRGKYWLPDIGNTLMFLLLGVLVPAVVESLFLQSVMLWSDNISFSQFWLYVSNNILAEFAITFFLTLPVLYYLTPVLIKEKIINREGTEPIRIQVLKTRQVAELMLVFLVLFSLVFIFDFTTYWYVYGFVSLYVAIRFGFGPAILTNLVILFITYILPTFFNVANTHMIANVNTFFIAANFLFVFAAITGRVISDLRDTEAKLIRKNIELEHTNDELDQFVYSVSHDLSAPLKSIHGLVNISRLTRDIDERTQYIDRIEQSVVKLEFFISQILDYSRNTRQDMDVDQVSLRELCDEVVDSLKFNHHVQDFDLIYCFEVDTVACDKIRLKIILNNLLVNAFKFRRVHEGHKHVITVRSKCSEKAITIEVEDNGEGIKPEHMDRIFEMFYRGHVNSRGSGLGLYIARQAAMKLGGKISVRSEFGKGSTFVLQIPTIR